MGQWLSIIPAIVPIGQCRGRLVVLCTVVSVAEVTLEVGLLPYLALLQFYKLCEDCNNKGVETEFQREGDITQIPDSMWEVILDNAFEAVSNAMKYARCKHIDIHIRVLNKMVRCSIIDDGIGCKEIHDGMGISGMRQRVRAAGGTLDFETEAGFKVSMLLPF